ncbi:glycosyltransferase family 2 protein [Patescibacteria group bacterium]|nr:glycosyltransferase family 2 protein [Patescibacteria group bacterium]
MKRPMISVIIPAYNEERDIIRCIDSLKNQTYKPLELIVVDDGSTDKTRKVLKKVKGIRLLRQEHRGPGAARNKGAKKAKGEILVFVDADMTFHRQFIKRLTRPIREGKAIGTFSKEEYMENPKNRWAGNWSINRGWQEGRMHPKDYPDTQRVFRAILKEKFDSVGGFDTNVGYTDDWTLSKKLRKEAIAAPGAIFYHRSPDSLSEAFRQAKWMAQRPYKLGILGRGITMARTSLPISLIVGVVKAARYKTPSFILFKIVVDFASFLGITRMFVGRQRVK